MKKLTIKILSVALVAAMLLSCVIVNAVTTEGTELVPSDEAYQYLWDQGFPREVVETLSAENIMEIYNGQYELQSVSITYGIFTESNSISYEIDESGNIVMDDDNRNQFHALLADSAKVQKILSDKASATTREEAAELVSAEPSANLNAIKPVDAVIRYITNFYGMITVININTSLDTMIKKKLIYSWHWNYNPSFKMMDQFAAAWADGFAYLPTTISSYYCATHAPTGISEQISVSYPQGYFTFTPNCSFGTRINLMSKIVLSDDYSLTPTKHSGNIQGNIVKYIPSSEVGAQHAVNVVGKYYHKIIDASDGAITCNMLPSITITFSDHYDEAPNSTGVFYYYN